MAVLLSRWTCSHSPRCQRQQTSREDRRPSSSTSYGTTSFDTPNARNASGRGGRTAAFNFYEIPDNLRPMNVAATHFHHPWRFHHAETPAREPRRPPLGSSSAEVNFVRGVHCVPSHQRSGASPAGSGYHPGG